MKIFKLLCLFGLALAAVAQGPAPDGRYHYFLPLPGTKTVAISDWQFFVELRALAPETPFEVDVVQHDIRGRELAHANFGLQPGGRVFQWFSKTESINGRLRALQLMTDQPVIGTLWMWNDIFGHINGVSIANHQTADLVVPHIPQEFFQMTTSFSVQGVSTAGASSSVNFSFFDQFREGHAATVLRSNWPTNGYLIFTPEITLSIGSLDENVTASWGRITSQQPDYLLTGFQTFTHEDQTDEGGFTQTAATELSAQGLAQGHLVFSKTEGLAFEDQLALTNPSDKTVRVELFLLSKSEKAPAEEAEPLVETQDQLHQVSEILELLPFQKRILVLGKDLFAEMEGTPVRLEYHASLTDQDGLAVPAPIFMLHFQNDLVDIAMGGHTATSAGTQVRLSMHGSEGDVSDRLELVSAGVEKAVEANIEGESETMEEPVLVREESLIEIVVTDENRKIGPTRHALKAGDTFAITSAAINTFFEQVFEDWDSGVVNVDINVVSGPPVIGKLTRFRANDIAVVNPFTTTSEVVGEEPPPEE